MAANLTVIVPLHKYDDEVNALLTKAIDSVPSDVEVRISCKKGIGETIKKAFKKLKNVIVRENDTDEDDFCTLVNKAVGGTEWFSILEYDDEYTPIWFENFKKYVDFYSDISVFLPLEDLIDNNGKFAGYGNEAPLASSFSNELGYIDFDCLQNFFDFYMTGGFFKTDDFLEVGGLKAPIKLTFWYEYLLRATHKGKKIFVVPRVGYQHKLGRPDSLIEMYKKTISKKESDFWINVARKECFFKEVRDQSKYTYVEKADEENDDED